jgi:hypothetical protein
MRTKAIAITMAILWGATMLVVGLINLAAPSYGADFLTAMSSIDCGFHEHHTFASVLIGTGYGVVEGAILGLILAGLYNAFAHSPATR